MAMQCQVVSAFVRAASFVLFLYFDLVAICLKILTVTTSLEGSAPCPRTKGEREFTVLIPPNDASLPLPRCPRRLCRMFACRSLARTVTTLGRGSFSNMIILKRAAQVRPTFLRRVGDIFSTNVRTVRLHRVARGHSAHGRCFRTLGRRVARTLFKAKTAHLKISSTLCNTSVMLSLG